MDYYQGVVMEYLRANRATFINTEYCIQAGDPPQTFSKGSHWYCDAVALSFAEKTIFLCEVTFAVKPEALFNRLLNWSKHWKQIGVAVKQDSHFGALLEGWQMQAWAFLPQHGLEIFKSRVIKAKLALPVRFTPLESTQPWRYKAWDRTIVPSEHPFVPSSESVVGL